ncbi:MAG: response regulator [Pseudomonadota bacterium]
MHKKYILVIDDEKVNQIILQEMLEEDYETLCAEDGENCLRLIKERTPDLILLDVNMPGLNGLEVCKEIRKNPQHINIPIIFVSALASANERLQGYKAGADDYITKPFVEQELLTKIKLLLSHQHEKITLKKSSDETMQALMTSLTNAGEQGEITNFMRKSFSCSDIENLTELVFNTVKQFKLSGSIMILAFEEPYYFFSDGVNRPLEKDILFYLHNGEHIISFSDRTVFNGNKLALLIRNMPEDEEISGRYRDHLAILVDGLAARVTAIRNEREMLKRKQMLSEIIQVTQKKLQSIDLQHQSQRVKHTQFLSDMAQNIEESFLHLGLSEIQEQKLLELVSKTESDTNNLYEEELQTDDEFNQIMKQLNISLTE